MAVEPETGLPVARVARGASGRPRGHHALWPALTALAAIVAWRSTHLLLFDRLDWKTCACDLETFVLEWGGPRSLASWPSSALLLGLAASSMIQVAVRRPRSLDGVLTAMRALAALWCVLALAMVAVSVWGTATAWVLASHGPLLALMLTSLVADRFRSRTRSPA